MARTLIGNIKGKDGRGITSIKKTGTTGPVDTYTITYTDSNTSTFTIKNSDSISLQRQIVPSAAVESSTTASQAYAVGDYVVVNGALRRVKSAIAKGNAISDSNSTATTVTGEIATLVESVSRQSSRVATGKMHRTTSDTGWIMLWDANQVRSEFGVAVANIVPVCVNDSAGGSDIWIEPPVMTGSGTWYSLCVCRDSNGWVKAVEGGISVPVSYRVEILG